MTKFNTKDKYRVGTYFKHCYLDDYFIGKVTKIEPRGMTNLYYFDILMDTGVKILYRDFIVGKYFLKDSTFYKESTVISKKEATIEAL